MRRAFPPAFLLSAALLAACASQPPSPTRPPHGQAEAAAIESALQGLRSAKNDYLIGGADLLEISVFQQPDLSRKLRVGQNGTISFPLIGTVQVGGLTPIAAEELLSLKLKEYLVAPQVTIFIKEYGNKRVFVLGEVKKPGSFELPTESQLTVLEAVSLAEGFTPIAAPDRTKVIRAVEGKSRSFTIVVSDITKRGKKDKDIPLEPNDVIFVPQSFF